MRKAIVTSVALVGIVGALSPSARAQMAMGRGGRSLGGYGAATIGSYYGGASGGYLPYTGGGGGFVPYRGGSSGGLGAQPISRRLPQTAIGGAMASGTPIGGASLGASMSAPRGAMGMSASEAARSRLPIGFDGTLGMGSMSLMPGPSAMSRRPYGPGFGYPFAMPSSLSGASSGAMSMP